MLHIKLPFFGEGSPLNWNLLCCITCGRDGSSTKGRRQKSSEKRQRWWRSSSSTRWASWSWRRTTNERMNERMFVAKGVNKFHIQFANFDLRSTRKVRFLHLNNFVNVTHLMEIVISIKFCLIKSRKCIVGTQSNLTFGSKVLCKKLQSMHFAKQTTLWILGPTLTYGLF